jgi:hypothetical protein
LNSTAAVPNWVVLQKTATRVFAPGNDGGAEET